MSELQITSFQDCLKNDNPAIHEELWRRLAAERFPDCKPEEVSFSSPETRKFDALITIPGRCVNFPLEYKTDYITIKTGNIVVELATVIMEKDFPKAFHGNSKVSVRDSIYFDVLSLIDSVNEQKLPESQGSRHFLSNDKYYFCYAVSKTDACNTNSVDDIAEYYVFYSISLAKFVRANYRNHNLIITKSKNKSSVWFTISMLIPCSDAKNLGAFVFRSNGTRIRKGTLCC